MDPLRVMVVAPDPLVRAALAAMMEGQPGCTVAGQAAGLPDLPSDVELYHPDVALVDLGVSFDLRPEVFEVDIGLPLVYLVPGGSIPSRRALMGVRTAPGMGRAFLAREASPQVIVHALQAVMDGLFIEDPRIENRPPEGVLREESENESRESRFKSREPPPEKSDPRIVENQDSSDSRLSYIDSRYYEPLTPRELEVLSLIAEGMPNKRVAQRLGISEHTVKYHLNTILGKLGAESRTEAVTRAARLGWLTL